MLKLLKRLSKKEIILIGISTIFIVVQVFLDLKLPDYMTEITTLIQSSKTSISDILNPGLKMLLCALGSLVSAFIVGYLISIVSATFSKKLRKEVFNKVEDFGTGEIKKFTTSSLITRTTNDVTQVQILVSMGTQVMIKAPILAVWAILKIAGKNWEWSMATGVTVILLMILMAILIIFAMPKFKIIQKLTDKINMITRENLTGIRVVRAYNAEDYQEKKFNKTNQELTNTNLFVQRVMALMAPFMGLMMSLLTLSIYFIGAYLINEASLMDKVALFSNMVVFSSYAMQVVMAFIMMSMIFILYPRSAVSAKRIIEVLDEDIKIIGGNITKSDIQGTIEFKKVSFKYPDAEEYMLKDISFKINKGETVAFIGSTGSGKSTLVNLIPRFYDASSGEILVNNINVKEFNEESLHKLIGYIPQKAVMFSGSVNFNVSFGSKGKIKKDKVKEAIKIAQGKDFVEKMAKKYDEHVAQGGTNISGGQKQRLAIARAVARDPEIFIFDDSFSALDYKTDYKLRKELKEYTKDATTLIVAQRIGTIKNADKIIVLDEGKVVGMGNHHDLMKSCQVYQEIALSQLSREELSHE